MNPKCAKWTKLGKERKHRWRTEEAVRLLQEMHSLGTGFFCYVLGAFALECSSLTGVFFLILLWLQIPFPSLLVELCTLGIWIFNWFQILYYLETIIFSSILNWWLLTFDYSIDETILVYIGKDVQSWLIIALCSLYFDIWIWALLTNLKYVLFFYFLNNPMPWYIVLVFFKYSVLGWLQRLDFILLLALSQNVDGSRRWKDFKGF